MNHVLSSAMRFVVAAIACAFYVVACSSSDAPNVEPTSDAGAEGSSSTALAAEEFLKSLCGYYEPCCSKVKVVVDSCIKSASELARGLTFDAARAQSCLDSLAAEKKNAGASGTLCGHSPNAFTCKAVFKKADAKPSGQACTLSAECASSPTAEGLCLSQKCQQVKRGKENDACSGTIANGNLDVRETKDAAICDATSDNLYCDGAVCKPRGAIGGTCVASIASSCVDTAWCPDTKQCSTRTQKGSPCTSADECAANLQCANDGTGNAKCLALEAEGGACVRGDECDTQQGLVCDSDTAKCILDQATYSLACKGSLALL